MLLCELHVGPCSGTLNFVADLMRFVARCKRPALHRAPAPTIQQSSCKRRGKDKRFLLAPRERALGEVRPAVLDVVASLRAEMAMIDIRHKDTGALLMQVPAETLAGLQLSDEVLRGADLHGADLRGIQLRRSYLIDVDLQEANLENARLNGADLTDVLLSRANLRGAHLTEAKVRNVDFRHADLSGAALQSTFLVNSVLDDTILTAANLRRATLIATSLAGARLSAADLTGALLLGVNLTRTNLTDACFAETFIADCRTLCEALGLHAIKHLDPSSLDVRTLRACVAHLPDAFLQSVGYTPEEIHTLKTLYAQLHP